MQDPTKENFLGIAQQYNIEATRLDAIIRQKKYEKQLAEVDNQAFVKSMEENLLLLHTKTTNAVRDRSEEVDRAPILAAVPENYNFAFAKV